MNVGIYDLSACPMAPRPSRRAAAPQAYKIPQRRTVEATPTEHPRGLYDLDYGNLKVNS
jgi:hypothetical protein